MPLWKQVANHCFFDFQADSLDGILNSSFQVLEDTTESSQNNLRSQVEGFMLWALDGNSSSVRWRQVFYQHVVRHDKQETLYSKTLVNGWATPLLPPNRTENCEEVECEEPTGFFTNTINIILVSGVAVLLTGIFATSISILSNGLISDDDTIRSVETAREGFGRRTKSSSPRDSEHRQEVLKHSLTFEPNP
ncbi:unnamed protein product [Nezara viridula]|uniref:Uncharacterized protein n=1 Tax=Nezara viridula TaxID=85310 RepID=A0A9P0HNA5_NEZVI|nr:unnamed protein product [Nezara viridula]